VQRDRIERADVAQQLARAAAGHHEILRNHLDEIDCDAMFEEGGIMRLAKPQAETRLPRHGQSPR